ncbi:hypothetical protein B0H66DRAFT_565998 [Apodospora peruviana]|uniref:RRM domain-containing protein n=1 Tax=Apodospora peruviana TaxID=516989 RepID=A0AAE0HV01_9PEZI|nr:hypothetical protein B0H66DRAFT_565998 [Apodospora peruviana]
MGQHKQNKRQRDVDEDVAEAVAEALNVDGQAAAATETDTATGTTTTPPTKKARVETNRSVFVRSLPANATAETLTEFFSQHYPVKHATVVLDPKTKTSRGYGFVTFTDPDDALEAKEKLTGQVLNGRKLKLDIAQSRHRDGTKVKDGRVDKVAEEKREREAALVEARKAPKLIIRNLPWSIKKPEQLENLFRPYGKVKFADLPNEKGKLAGFGFVTLRGRPNAERALAAVNGKEVDGRTLAVDWAVDKQTWDSQNHDDESDKEEKKMSKDKKEKKTKEVKGNKKDDEEEDEEMDQADRDLLNFFKNQGENLEDETDDENGRDKDQEDLDEEEDDVFEDDDDDSEGGADLSEKAEEKPKKMTDNSTTLFIRNLPYTATDETLKAKFTHFGPVRYARVVMDRALARPAGTGFVCFFNEEDFRTCLKGAPRNRPDPTLKKHSVLQDETVDPDGNYTLDGRVLQVTQAVSKDEATRLETEGLSKKDKDKRRLYLLNEGTIPASSPLFAKLSATEVRMRETSARQRKKLIQTNPSLHLSLTRLALRNLPHNIGSKELKALAREAVVGFAKDVKEGKRQPLSKEENSRGGQEDKEAEHRRKEKKKGVVRQAKVVFESKEGSKVSDEKDGGKSRGYGFIEYSSHRWALMGLRWLNGHAMKNEAGKTQRLIAEFAIENVNVVQRRKAMEEKGRLMAASGGKPNGEKRQAMPKGRGQTNRRDREREAKGRGKDGKDKFKGPAPNKKGGKGETEVKKKGGVPEVDDTSSKVVRKDADAKLALRTKIIARKRMMRKKKGDSRGKK